MKHLLNDLSSSEKNRILEQYENSILVETKKFNKLINSKLGDAKPLLFEKVDSNVPTISPQDKKLLWNKISSSPELKQHLNIMPHHTEHNFWEEIGHKLHFHVDPKGEHVELEFPRLGKHHNIKLSVGGSYNPHHFSSHGETSWKQPVANVGISTTFGGGHKKQQPKPLF